MDALGAVDVLERGRDAGQRAGVARISLAGAALVGASSLPKSQVAGSLRPDKGVQHAIELRDAFEEEARQLD